MGKLFITNVRFKLGEKGFTLIETVIGLLLVGFFINGLLLTWYFIDSRQKSMEEYWKVKEDLELAFETTQHLIRDNAVSDLTLLDNGISFTDSKGATWEFVKNGPYYQKIINGQTENLLNNCSFLQFTQDNRILKMDIQAAPPSKWEGDSADLRIDGQLFLRNYH